MCNILWKAYRSYEGNFKRLTDMVRCSLVLDTPDDMIQFVKARVSDPPAVAYCHCIAPNTALLTPRYTEVGGESTRRRAESSRAFVTRQRALDDSEGRSDGLHDGERRCKPKIGGNEGLAEIF